MSNMLNIYGFADEADAQIDGQINAMKRNKLQGLEIRNIDGENIVDISKEKAKEVKRKLDANGLLTWSIGSPIGKINITEPFSAHLEKFKYTLELAEILETSNIRIFSFYIPAEGDAENYKNEVVERLGILLDTAKGSGIRLCHENEKGIYGDTAERCLYLYKTLPDLKGIFDPANFVQCGVNTLKAWELLKSYIGYMHIKDAKKDGMVVPAGCGEGNIEKIVRDYISIGGRDFTIEPHLAVFDGFKKLEKEGEKSVIVEYMYDNNNDAFDAACNAFKQFINRKDVG